jgi:hypothetical protein
VRTSPVAENILNDASKNKKKPPGVAAGGFFVIANDA